MKFIRDNDDRYFFLTKTLLALPYHFQNNVLNASLLWNKERWKDGLDRHFLFFVWFASCFFVLFCYFFFFFKSDIILIRNLSWYGTVAIPEGPETANFSHLPVLLRWRNCSKPWVRWRSGGVIKRRPHLNKRGILFSKDSDTKNLLVCYRNAFWFPSKIVFW